MNNRNIFSKQNLVDGVLLSGVEPWETDGRKGEFLGLAVVVEDVAQLCETVAFGPCDLVNGLEHELISVLIERELHSHSLAAL